MNVQAIPFDLELSIICQSVIKANIISNHHYYQSKASTQE